MPKSINEPTYDYQHHWTLTVDEYQKLKADGWLLHYHGYFGKVEEVVVNEVREPFMYVDVMLKREVVCS